MQRSRSPRSRTRHAWLAALPLALLPLGCSSSSSDDDGGGGGSGDGDGTLAAAASDPSGEWIVDLERIGGTCSEEFDDLVSEFRDFIVITVSGNTVTIESLVDMGNPPTTGTLDGRTFSWEDDDGTQNSLTFDAGFQRVSGTITESDDFFDDDAGEFVECTIDTRVDGRRPACSGASLPSGPLTVRLFLEGNEIASVLVAALQRVGCGVQDLELAGVIDGQTLVGRLGDQLSSQVQSQLDFTQQALTPVRFTLALGSSGILQGNWSVQVLTTDFDPQNPQDFSSSTETLSGTIQVEGEDSDDDSEPDCDAIEEGTWDFTFVTTGGVIAETIGFQGELAQNGCSIDLDGGGGDDFSGTLDGADFTASGSGFWASYQFQGAFTDNGTRFDGTGSFFGGSVSVTGELTQPDGGGDDGGGSSDCPDVPAGPWIFTSSPVLGGGDFSLSGDCTLTYSASDFLGGSVTVSGPLDGSGRWIATGDQGTPGATATVNVDVQFSGDPATSFSGTAELIFDGFSLGSSPFEGSLQ